MTVSKLYVYGDQMISSPGDNNGFLVEPGEHWWEILAKERGLETVHINTPQDNIQISQVYWLSKLVEVIDLLGPRDKLLGVVPSAHRSLHWQGNKPKHHGTLKPGPHKWDSYVDWQHTFTYNILNKIAPKKKSCFFMQQIKGCELQSTANIKVLDVKRVGDLNWFWNWTVNQGKAKQAKTEKEFYDVYTQDRKLNALGHREVYKAVKRYMELITADVQ